MTTSPLCLLAWTLAILAVPFLLLDRLLETEPERAQRLRQTGYSQARIAELMGVSRYRVRRLLAA